LLTDVSPDEGMTSPRSGYNQVSIPEAYMAKAKRERRNSFRTMAADQALEALDRIEQMEREEQAAAPHAEPVPAVPEAEADADHA
jgi:hypothetical protein